MFKEATENLLFFSAVSGPTQNYAPWKVIPVGGTSFFWSLPGRWSIVEHHTRPWIPLSTRINQLIQSCQSDLWSPIVEMLLDRSPLPPSGLGSLWTTDHETFTVSRHVPTSRALALPWVMKSSWRMCLEALFFLAWFFLWYHLLYRRCLELFKSIRLWDSNTYSHSIWKARVWAGMIECPISRDDATRKAKLESMVIQVIPYCSNVLDSKYLHPQH